MPSFLAEPSICAVSYSYTLLDDTGATVACNCFDSATLTLTYQHTVDLLPSGNTFRDYTLQLTGVTGTNNPVAVSTSFNLRVKNPCIDPDFVSIQTVPLPSGLEYALFSFDATSRMEFSHSSFIVVTSPIASHTLCGPLSYEATFESTPIDSSTSPMAYNSDT